jgi:hypothetical protein
MYEPHSCARIGFNQQVNRAIAAINGDINCEPSGDTNVRFLELNLAGSSVRSWPEADPAVRQLAAFALDCRRMP